MSDLMSEACRVKDSENSARFACVRVQCVGNGIGGPNGMWFCEVVRGGLAGDGHDHT